MSSQYRRCLVLLAISIVITPAALLAAVVPSHVRVVSVSYSVGDVNIVEPGSSDPAAAPMNTPIRDGATLKTGDNSYAEVEFENGSTVRIGERSQLEFKQLAVTPQGDTLNTLHLEFGYATFHFMPRHHDEDTVQALDTTLRALGSAEFRTDIYDEALRVEVISGKVHAARAAEAQNQDLSKNKVLALIWKVPESFRITEGFTKDVWDKWVQARDLKALLRSNN